MRSVLVVAGLLSLGGAATVQAYGYTVQPTGNVHYAYGEVLDARPVYRTVQRPTSQQVCWDQPVEYYERGRPASPAGTLVGAVIGGVVGSQLGRSGSRHSYPHYRRGPHRDATTAAGAALGATIGYQASRQPDRVSYGHQQRCEVQRTWQESHDIVGYDVTYRYRGEVYHTRTDAYPGDSIRVRVAVDAVH